MSARILPLKSSAKSSSSGDTATPFSTAYTASGPMDALLSDAYTRGRRAGLLGLSPALNEYAEGTAEHLQWEQGRNSVLVDAMRRKNSAARLVVSKPPDDTQ